MAKAKKQKMQLLAHSAKFLNPSELTFEDLVQRISAAGLNQQARTYAEVNSSNQAALSGFTQGPRNRGIGFNISFYEVDARHSTIRTGSGGGELEIGSADAGDGHEFLSQNVSVYAVGDQVITCGLRKRGGALCTTIINIARDAGIIDATQNVGLFPLPHPSTVDLIKKHGVKSIELDVTPLVRDMGRSHEGGLIRRIFNPDSTAEAVRRRGDNVFRLSILTRRFMSKAKLDTEEQFRNVFLDNVSLDVLEDHEVDNFTIILGTGQPIKNGSLVTTKRVDVSRNNTTHSHTEAHQEMVRFMAEIS